MTVNGHISSLGKKSISQPILHAAYRAHEVWDIFFHPAQFFQRPCNVCTPCFYLKEVWFLGKASFSCFEQYPFFSPLQDVLSAKGLRASGVVPGGGGGVCSLRRQAVERLCATARLVSSTTTRQTRQEEGKERKEGRVSGGLVYVVVTWIYTALKWRCPSRRGNQDPRGKRRRARMRVKSWRRAHAAAGRSEKSRLVRLSVFMCVFVWNASDLLFNQGINEWSYSLWAHCTPCIMQCLSQLHVLSPCCVCVFYLFVVVALSHLKPHSVTSLLIQPTWSLFQWWQKSIQFSLYYHCCFFSVQDLDIELGIFLWHTLNYRFQMTQTPSVLDICYTSKYFTSSPKLKVKSSFCIMKGGSNKRV